VPAVCDHLDRLTAGSPRTTPSRSFGVSVAEAEETGETGPIAAGG
jgi:hypothetical protein